MSRTLSGVFRSTLFCMVVATASMKSRLCRLVKRFSMVTRKVSFSPNSAASSAAACLISSRFVWTTFWMGMIRRA